MYNSIEILKKDYGYVVIIEQEDASYTTESIEELALEHPLAVLEQVLQWLGYGDAVEEVFDLLDEVLLEELEE